jgi:hypothetical protein
LPEPGLKPDPFWAVAARLNSSETVEFVTEAAEIASEKKETEDRRQVSVPPPPSPRGCGNGNNILD